MARVMTGYFKKRLPFASINPNNLLLNCGCKFLEFCDGKFGQKFYMEPKCLKHTIKYYEWKLRGKTISLDKLQMTYKWNEYSDGSVDAVK